jgi:hypothetical protein
MRLFLVAVPPLLIAERAFDHLTAANVHFIGKSALYLSVAAAIRTVFVVPAAFAFTKGDNRYPERLGQFPKSSCGIRRAL